MGSAEGEGSGSAADKAGLSENRVKLKTPTPHNLAINWQWIDREVEAIAVWLDIVSDSAILPVFFPFFHFLFKKGAE